MVNIKKFIKDALSNSEILNLTADKKVYFIHANKPNTPYVEYEIFDENGQEWAENKEIATNFYLQVDIFSKTDYTDLENKIKEVMINAGFNRSMAADLYENDTQLFHKSMHFFITLEVR